MIGLTAFRQFWRIESLAGMARFKHEVTNRKVHVYNSRFMGSADDDWKPLKAIYPVKCAACKEWIAKGAKILWHTESKLVMHVDC
jgi:hypothetical protein